MSHDKKSINLNTLSGLTMGFTGADIKNMINYAGFEALRRNETKIYQ